MLTRLLTFSLENFSANLTFFENQKSKLIKPYSVEVEHHSFKFEILQDARQAPGYFPL